MDLILILGVFLISLLNLRLAILLFSLAGNSFSFFLGSVLSLNLPVVVIKFLIVMTLLSLTTVRKSDLLRMIVVLVLVSFYFFIVPPRNSEIIYERIVILFLNMSCALIGVTQLRQGLLGKKYLLMLSLHVIIIYRLLLYLGLSFGSRSYDVSVIDISRDSMAIALFFVALNHRKITSFLFFVASGALSFWVLTRQGIYAWILARFNRSFSVVLGMIVLIGSIIIFSESLTHLRMFQLTSISRLPAYFFAFEMFKVSPLIGSGFGSFGIFFGDAAQYPHNLILEILAEGGIIGLGFWIMLSYLVSRLYKNFFSEEVTEILKSLFWYYFLLSMVSYNVAHSCVLLPLSLGFWKTAVYDKGYS